MPKEQEDFQAAVSKVMEAVIFEAWLRFYFIVEAKEGASGEKEEKEFLLAVPEKAMQKIAELYPEMLPLAESLNDKPINFDISMRAILSFVMEHVEGKEFSRELLQSAMSSTVFKARQELFHAWTQIHEQQLEKQFLDFGAWRELFNKWLNSDAARDLVNPPAEAKPEA